MPNLRNGGQLRLRRSQCWLVAPASNFVSRCSVGVHLAVVIFDTCVNVLYSQNRASVDIHTVQDRVNSVLHLCLAMDTKRCIVAHVIIRHSCCTNGARATAWENSVLQSAEVGPDLEEHFWHQ